MNNTTINPKLRSDSVFAQLTNEQIEQLEDWLFEEKLSYKEVLAKLQHEFNIKTSQTALGRFFRRIAKERTEELRIETVVQSLEALAAAKGDGTLQAGLFVMANMHAVRLMTEEKPSLRELTTFLRSWTSASVYETKRAENYEVRERQRLAEIERKEKEARETEERARSSAEYRARCDASEAKRKATIAAKKAAAEAAKKAAMPNEQGQMPKGEAKPVAEAPAALELAEVQQPSKAVAPERPTGVVEYPEGTIDWGSNPR